MAPEPELSPPDPGIAVVPPMPQSSSPTETSPPGVSPSGVEEVSTPAPLPAITLQQAILETLQCDPKLRSALENIAQAKADLVTSAIIPNPTLAVTGIFLPGRPITPAAPGGPPELDVLASFPLDWFLFGKQAAAIAAAQWGVEVSAADYADAVRLRVADTVAAFYDILEARAMLKLAQEDLASLQRVEDITRRQVKLGGAGSIEVDRIRLSVLDSQRDVRTRQATLTTAKAKLQALLGRHQADGAFEVGGSLEVTSPAPPMETAEALAVAEENRPDLISLRKQIAKACASAQAEHTKAYPSVAPGGGLQYQFQGSEGLPDFPSYNVGVNVSIPLFDRNQGNICKAHSVLAQSKLNLQAQYVQLQADLEQAVAEFRTARLDATSIGPEQLQAAKSVRDRTEAAYKVGGKTLLEVMDAERAYRDTSRTYIMGQSGYWHSLHRLNAAVGKQVLR
jgi:cobalt-zinc-cadmium efflux system outer membrane protein